MARLGLAVALFLGGCSLFAVDGLTDGKSTGAPGDGVVNSSPDSAANDSAQADAGSSSFLPDGSATAADASLDSSITGQDVVQTEMVDGSAASDARRESAVSDGAMTDAVATDSSVTVVTRSDGSTCKDDLSNIGTADFDISFTVASEQTGVVALVNQRVSCNDTDFWDVQMNGGFITVEVSAQGDETSFPGSVRMNDGRPHDVLVRRVSERLAIYVDGFESGPNSAPIAVGPLAALSTGTDPCMGAQSFVGTITNLCIASP
jgi:hypothetical protein